MAASTPTTIVARPKRKQVGVVPFEATPAGSAKMVSQMQISLSRKRKNKQANDTSEGTATAIAIEKSIAAAMSAVTASSLSSTSSTSATISTASAASASISASSAVAAAPASAIDVLLDKLSNKARIELHSKLVDRLSGSADGRTGIARKFREKAGKRGSMTLSTNSTSDSAKALSRKTMCETLEGVAATINPSDPKKAASRMKGLRTPLGCRRPPVTSTASHHGSRLSTVFENESTRLSLSSMSPSSPPPTSSSPYQHLEILPQPQWLLDLQVADDNYRPPRGRKKKGDNWKGNESMIHVTQQQIEAVRNDLGVLLPYVRRMTRSRDRRPYLAMPKEKKHSRAAVCHALDMEQKINDTEWKEIGIHAVLCHSLNTLVHLRVVLRLSIE